MELSTTIPALLRQQSATFGSETILRKKERGIWNTVSWLVLEERVRNIGQGLRAAGLAPDEAAAVLSETRPDLVYADLAILGCGAASVAIHPGEAPEKVREILRETAATVAIVENEEQLDKVLTLRPYCPALRRIVIMDSKGLRDFNDPSCISLIGLIKGGADQSDWNAKVAAVTPDQIAAIIVPRHGAIYAVTHAMIMRQIDEAGRDLDIRASDERLAVLPMSEAAERVLGLYLALKHRVISNYLENPETATENLREVKPTVFGADTDAWERLHARTTALADAATTVQKALYRWAINAGAAGGLAGALANMLVLPSVRSQLGFGNLRVAYVGDGMISPEVDHWARGLGITVRHIDPFTNGGTHA